MPGTGHSARYKGSISNRVRTSPFEQLANWNAQLLGADGMIPSITGGGGSLEFKKLDASDISGVMSNPATANLDMNCLDISAVNQLKFCPDGYIRIPRGPGTTSWQPHELIITNNNTNPNIQIQDKPLKLSSLGLSTTTNHVDLILDASSATNNIELSARGVNTNNGKIFIGWESDPGAPSTSVRTINIGHRTTLHGGKQVINIGVVSTASTAIDAGTITIGSAAINTFTNINAGTNLGLGSSSTIQAALTGSQTHVTGTDRLNLRANAGGMGIFIGSTGGAGKVFIGSGAGDEVQIGSTTGDKIGFFGHAPKTRPSVKLPTNYATLPTTAAGSYTTTQQQQILNAIVNNGEAINCLIRALDQNTGSGLGLVSQDPAATC